MPNTQHNNNNNMNNNKTASASSAVLLFPSEAEILQLANSLPRHGISVHEMNDLKPIATLDNELKDHIWHELVDKYHIDLNQWRGSFKKNW